MKLNLNWRDIALTLFICSLMLLRFVDFHPGFSPVLGIILFAGLASSNVKQAILNTTLAYIVATLIVSGGLMLPMAITLFAFYIGIAIILSVNRHKLQHHSSMMILLGVPTASILFYLITNFVVWAEGWIPYTRDLSGLITCYAAGLPFLKWAMFGDIIFFILADISFLLVTYMVVGLKPSTIERYESGIPKD